MKGSDPPADKSNVGQRLAVIGPTYPVRGGISHYTTLLVRRLRERHEVLFLSYRRQYPRFLFPGRTQVDASSAPIGEENEPVVSFSNPLSWRAAARRVEAFDPRAVVISWVNPALAVQLGYIAGRVRRHGGAGVVFWCHNVVQHERRPLERALTRLAFRYADSFLVTGEESRVQLLDLLPGSRVEVANLPPLEGFETALTRGEARARLGLAHDAPLLLHFGFVRPYKGLQDLLEALPAAIQAVPGLRLLVAGEFWEDRGVYEGAAARLGVSSSVDLVDRYIPNEEVGAYFAAADLVVMPYRSATGSGVVQLAYSFGVPVLTTAVGSLPEVVADGETGYLVPPEDPAALAAAIARHFTSRGSADFPAGIRRALAAAGWERTTGAIETLATEG